MCSKHVEARNKLIVKQNIRASSWLITEINTVYIKAHSYVAISTLDIGMNIFCNIVYCSLKMCGTSARLIYISFLRISNKKE